MIRFHTLRSKNLHVPARSEPRALDQERSFLLRVVGQSMKKEVTCETRIVAPTSTKNEPCASP